MSTNYYFKIKNVVSVAPKEKASKLKENIISKIEETIEELSYIHIGKRSSGWEPLFQKTEYFSSVADIKKFYNTNKDDIIILDEYDRELSLSDLEEDLFNWNMENTEAREHDMDGSGEFYRDLENFCFCIYDFS